RWIVSGAERIGVAAPGPRVHCFARLMFDRAKFDVGALRRDAGLLPEFAAGGVEQFLPLVDEPLGDRPRASVFVLPPRPTRVGEIDLEFTRDGAVEEEAGGEHFGLWSTHGD